jgi:putative ABC transport system permease protein
VEEILKNPRSRIPAWTLRREYRSTYRATLSATEQLVAGAFTGRVKPGATPVPVSLEEGLAGDLQLKPGDALVFDVQGVPVPAVVSSLRRVEWQRFQPNFFVVFPLGVLEAAPKFFLAAARAGTPADSARVQRAVAREFPNVSAIDLAQVQQTIDGMLSKVAFVITLLTLFTVATGLIVLTGAVLSGRFQRIRECVLLRALGATRQQVARILLVEYVLLGTLAAATGVVLAVGADALLAKFVFHALWSLHLPVLLAAWVAVDAVTVLAGLLANRGVCDHPPLEVLRGET